MTESEKAITPKADNEEAQVKSPEVSSEKPEMTVMEEVIDTAKFVALAVAFTLIIRMFLFQPFNIPSGSMKPNLLVGDFLFVSKGTYGYSSSSLVWPLTRISGEGRVMGREPVRGEVIVFKNALDENKDYIKRLIGMPGDTVQMINGQLYLNDTLVPRVVATDFELTCSNYFGEAAAYRETLPNGTEYIIQECAGNNGRHDTTAKFTVPADHFFLMGDNRDNSLDSRTDKVSFVPREKLVGKAQVMFFSVDGEKSRFWQIWKWPGAIRYSRIFSAID